MSALALPLLLVCGCGAPAQVAAGGGREELDLSQLIVWRGWGGDCVWAQTFYDRSGRRVDNLDLGYQVGRRGPIYFSEGLAVATLSGEEEREGYVDRAGRVVIPFRFRWACSFKDGRAVVAAPELDAHGSTRLGLIDRRGRWVVPAGKYDGLGTGSEGRWPFRIQTSQADTKPSGFFEEDGIGVPIARDDGKRWGFLDANGTVVVEPKYREVGSYSEGLCFVRDGNTPAYIDRQGRTAFRLPRNTDGAGGFRFGRALIGLHMGKKRQGKVGPFGHPTETDLQFGFLARDGTMAIKPVYTAAGGFTEGLAPVSVSDKAEFFGVEDETVDGFFGPADDGQRWGFIDPNGTLVIPMRFNRVSHFWEGRARARHNGKWGFIDKTGEFVIPPRFDWVESFGNGVATAVLDGKLVLIDRQGKILVHTGTEHMVF